MQSALERVVQHRVALVLTIAGIVDVATGDPVAHGAALVAVAVLVASERFGERRTESARVGGRSRAAFRMSTPLAIAAVVYAAVVGTFARWSWPISVAVAIPGALAVAFAWVGTPPATDDDGRRTGPSAVPWVVFLLALAAWEIEALLLQPSLTTSSYAHPTLSTLMDPVLASHLGRSITLAGWLWFGGYLLER